MKMKKVLSLTAFALIGVAMAMPSAFAQIDEIVVTAQKRAESINDVPIAINALDGSGLESMGISDTDDIIDAFPNLGSNVRSAYNSGVSIRGVGTDNFHISGQQSVGTYIDDVSVVSPFINSISVFDMDRVEVLRGPQNTLYGRNTTGGAVLWHTKKADPSEGKSGYASATAGEGGLAKFEGAVGFGVSDKFAIRVSGMTDSFDGLWEDVVTGKDTGGAYDRNGARVNLQFDISPVTSLNIGVSYGDTEGEDTGYAYRGNRTADGTPDPTLSTMAAENSAARSNAYVRVTEAEVAGSTYLTEQFNAGTGMVIVNPDPNAGAFTRLINYSTDFGKTYVHPEAGYEAEWRGVRANLTHSLDGLADLTILASYDETETLGVNIADLTGFGVVQDGEWDVMQLEARLTSTNSDDLRWLVGLYYSTEDSKQDTWVRNGGAAGGRGVVPGIDIDSDYTNRSIYGQVDYQLHDALNLTGGLRFTDDKLEGDWARTICVFAPNVNNVRVFTRDVRANGCEGFRQNGQRTTQNPVQELEEFGWKIGADYSTVNDTLLYASISEGFKGGAYDNRPLATGELPIGPEFLTAYEIGVKSQLADDRVQINGAVFLYEWEDLQLFDIIRDPQQGNVPALLNVPETELTGLELEVQYAPNDRWYISAAVGLVDTEVTNTAGIPPLSAVDVGDEVTNTADFTSNLTATYTTPVASGEMSFTASWRHASDYYYTFTQDDSARGIAPSQDYVNADVTYAFGTDLQHSVRLFGRNLTEEFHCSGLQDGPVGGFNYSCRIGNYGERQLGLNFKTNF